MGIDISQSSAADKSFQIYLVGGAVRDKLLNLKVIDRDWVVVGATEEDMLEMGYIPVSGAFPVFLHPRTGEEYALARREIKTGPGYHGFSVESGPDVTLEEDLARRDLTINAMAEDSDGNIVDPFGGREDLDNGILRHVTPAFVEDPVRLLRIARFSARFGQWCFRIAHGTHALMKKMVASGELAHLQGPRIWQEMSKALMDDQPWRFFQVLHACGALEQLFPALAAALSETSGHGRAEDSEPIAVLKRAKAQSLEMPLRFACIMQYAVDADHGVRQLVDWLGVGKKTAALLTGWLEARIRLPQLLKGKAADYLSYLLQYPNHLEVFSKLAEVCMPDVAERVLPFLEKARSAMRAVDTGQLQAEGWQGKALGEELLRRRRQAISVALEETADA